ncbi:hypothetical protein TNCV_194881 [Trichonephila clavipes]|uniref:Uncharacterized protein n=1 Tax=Trichonephila clavipes TaxID=2585209 RepID=A0A8X6WIG9_TRICX|nr:hypothetical protein TNCV_194881 [Trichonephila clavipes]
MWLYHFRHGQRAMNMNRYTNAELVDIHFNYGPANGNGLDAARLHRERYSTKWTGLTESSNVRSGESEPGGTWMF